MVVRHIYIHELRQYRKPGIQHMRPITSRKQINLKPLVARKSELLVKRCYNLPAYLMIEMLLLSPIIIAPCRDDQNMLQMD